jgi:penicillin-binding protein 1C
MNNRQTKSRILLTLGLSTILVTWFWFSLPKPLFSAPTSYVIEDEKGVLLGASIAKDGQWRFPTITKVPEKFSQCIITFEDKRFYYHLGFDPLAILRALKQNLKNKQVISGGSTISMQVIRLSRKKPRTIWQKIREVILAIRMELTYSKKEILALYASNAPFGTNVVGLDAASWRYFGRSPEQLSWGEMAALAILPNAPSLVHPGKNREILTKKRNQLLDQLVAQTKIDPSTAKLAKLEPIPEKPLPLPQLAPNLLDRFRVDFPKLKLQSTRLKTTVHHDLQQNINSLLQRYHQQFKSNGINNAAALVLSVETGYVLAYVGNVNDPGSPEAESQVDMIPASRSPGSTLKPILYASMLSDGLFLPNSLVPDVPTQIGGYTPQNFDLGYDGAVPAAKALYRSLNVPSVKMLQQYKYERFHQQLKNMGITTLKKPADFYGLSLILGGCETSMWDLSGVYASMARTLNHYNRYKRKYNGDDYHPPSYVKKDINRTHPILQRATWIDYGSLWFTFQAMQEVMRPGEELLWEQFSSSQKIAWKTGTSFGFRDGWAIGLTPQYVVCVWVGNADGEGRPGLIGIETAAPILFDIFDLLPQGKWFDVPYTNLVTSPICRQSGFKANPHCFPKDTLYIPVNGIKTVSCPYHQLVHLNKSQTYQVTSDCESPDNMIHQPWFILPPAMEYYYKTRHRDYKMIPPYSPACMNDLASHQQMELIYPKNHAKVYIPVEIDGKRGKVIFNAAHHDAKATLFWHLDDEFVGKTVDFHQLALDPPPGKHRLTLVDDKGNSVMQFFEVLDKNKGK